jgi:hypothetical protein
LQAAMLVGQYMLAFLHGLRVDLDTNKGSR